MLMLLMLRSGGRHKKRTTYAKKTFDNWFKVSPSFQINVHKWQICEKGHAKSNQNCDSGTKEELWPNLRRFNRKRNVILEPWEVVVFTWCYLVFNQIFWSHIKSYFDQSLIPVASPTLTDTMLFSKQCSFSSPRLQQRGLSLFQRNQSH